MPEYAQFEEVTGNNTVDPGTGNFTYTIPLLDVPGPGGAYPLALSYHAGITHEQEATWVGLGWSLNAGAINRLVRGVPDDYLNSIVTTHNINPGVEGMVLTVSLGYGPVGLSTSWDTRTGSNLGANPYFSITGLLASIAQGTACVDAAGAQTFTDVMGYAQNLDITVSQNGINASYALSAQGTGPAAGVGISLATISVYNDWKKIGPTTNVSFSPGVGLHGFGVGGSIGSNSVGSGNFQHDDPSGISVSIYGYHIGVAFMNYSWSLDETYWDLMNGFLWQAGENSGVIARRKPGAYGTVDPNGNYTVVPGVQKYERLRLKKELQVSPDLYTVSGDGISGTFEPYFAAPYSGYNGVFPTLRDGDLAQNKEGMIPTNPASLGDITFRMDGDPGRNLLHVPTGSSDQVTPYSASGAQQKQYGSYRIEPVFEKENLGTVVTRGSLQGFKIKDAEGKTYEYLQPLKNSLTTEVTSDNYSTISATRSERIMYDPYAVSWLLTSIKGADYVAIGHTDGIPDAGDFGYWVKFNYTSPNQAAWTAPIAGNVGSPKGNESGTTQIYERSTGFKELIYLSNIETETHKAVFDIQDRLDGASVQNSPGALEKWQPLGYPGSIGYWPSFPVSVPNIPYSLDFPGNFYEMLLRLYQNRALLSQSDLNSTVMHIGEDWMVAGGYTGKGEMFTLTDMFEGTVNPTVNNNPAAMGGSYIANMSFDPIGGNTHFNMVWYYNSAEQPRRIPAGYPFRVSIKAYAFIDVNMIEALLDKLPHDKAFAPPKLLSTVTLYNKKALSTPLKTIQFRYNYELCPGTPNSFATTSVGSSLAPYYVGGSADKGKLTLKEVQTYGRGIFMPPYLFTYQKDSGNPQYGNKEQYDIWGMYKGDGAVNQHLTNQGNPTEGVAWNLTHIQAPLGGAMDVEYERDSYYFAGTGSHIVDNQETVLPDFSLVKVPTDASGKPDFSSLPKISVPAHNPISYGNGTDFLKPQPGKATYNISSEEAKLSTPTLSLDKSPGVLVGDYVFVVQVLKMIDNSPGSTFLRQHNGILNMGIVTSVSGNTISLEPVIQKTSANGFFLWKNFNYSTFSTTYSYYLLPILPGNKKRVFYGGDIAVKSVQMSDGLGANYKVLYDYIAKDVRGSATAKAFDREISSGGTYGLPSFYSSRVQFFPQFGAINLDVGLRFESNPDMYTGVMFTINRPTAYDPVGDFIKSSYFSGDKPGGAYYPSPGVMYSRVNAKQMPSTVPVSDTIGSTEYQFNGLAYYFLHTGGFSGGVPIINRKYTDWSTTDVSNNLTINADVLSKKGQLAAIITWDKNHTASSQALTQYSASPTIYEKGVPKTNVSAGWVKQTYSSQMNVGTSTPGPLRITKFISPASYQTGMTNIQFGVSKTAKNVAFDANSGQVLAVQNTNSDGRFTVDYSMPAYWVNPDMEADNAMLQTREHRTYGYSSGSTFNPTDVGKVVKAQYSEWNGFYTGPDGSDPSTPTHKWHKIFTAEYNAPLNSSGYLASTYPQSMPFGGGRGDDLSEPWLITSDHTVFNRFSMPVESRDMIRKTYAATYFGHGTNLMMGTVDDATFAEAGIFTGDYDLNEGAYFDKFNRWERGAGIGDPNHVSELVVGPHVFGSKSIHVKNAFGPTLNVRYDMFRRRPYIMTAWIMPVSGTCTMAYDFRDLNWVTFKDGSGNPISNIAVTTVTADGGGFRLIKAEMPYTRTPPDETYGLRGFVGCPDGGEAYIQDIRFHPVDALAKSYFYDPVTQDLLTTLDENNHAKNFSYDGFGRLISIKNEKLETISSANYHFFGP